MPLIGAERSLSSRAPPKPARWHELRSGGSPTSHRGRLLDMCAIGDLCNAVLPNVCSRPPTSASTGAAAAACIDCEPIPASLRGAIALLFTCPTYQVPCPETFLPGMGTDPSLMGNVGVGPQHASSLSPGQPASLNLLAHPHLSA